MREKITPKGVNVCPVYPVKVRPSCGRTVYRNGLFGLGSPVYVEALGISSNSLPNCGPSGRAVYRNGFFGLASWVYVAILGAMVGLGTMG